MFASERSPRGGNPIAHLWNSVKGRYNVNYDPSKRPEIQGDFLTLRFGWATDDIKRGDPIVIKRSTAKYMIKLLEEFAE